ncbi:hypothetical protein [Streptomyces sp. NPDC018693]|uniref:hypothetical protein n=1 Tax=unclassified Streptomyces TaxID=2593676 RepID=UPI00378C1AFF
MTSATPDVTPRELANALTLVSLVLRGRAKAGGDSTGEGSAYLDRRACLQVAADLPPMLPFDRNAWVAAWQAAREDGSLPYRKALYRKLCQTLADSLDYDGDRWEGHYEPAEFRRLASRVRSIETKVCLGGSLGPFDAMVDPADRWNGSVSPRFTLDTVRELAAEIQRQAEHPDFVDDTVHVIDRGRTDRDGRPMVVVLKVSWQQLGDDGPDECTDVIEPDEEGRYAIAAWEWTWSYASWWCTCSEGHDWHVPQCEDCGMTRDQSLALKEAAPRIGQILRALAPEVTAALFETDGTPRIVGVFAGYTELNIGDGGPFDSETLGEADAALHAALGSDLTASGPHWLRFS